MRFTVVLIPDECSDRYAAYVPAIPGCFTYGDTVEETLARAQDAATGILTLAIEQDDDIPIEPAGAIIANIEVAVAVPAEAAA